MLPGAGEDIFLADQVQFGSSTRFAAASGNDFAAVSRVSFNGNATFRMNAGNDRLVLLDDSSFRGGAVFDGGSGTDTIARGIGDSYQTAPVNVRFEKESSGPDILDNLTVPMLIDRLFEDTLAIDI